MPKAARVGDSCVHPGSKLATGSPDVIVEGQKQSRLTDVSLGCTVPIPTPPHAVGHLSKCSLTVFVNSLGAARVGDLLICPSPPAGPGPPGGPNVSVKGYCVSDADNFVGKLYHGGRTGDADNDGTKDTAEYKAGIYQRSKAGDGYKVTADVITLEGKATANSDEKAGSSAFEASGKFRALGVSGEKSTERGGGWKGAGEAQVGAVDATARGGSTRYGSGLQAEAKASAARGQVSGEFGGTKTNPFKAQIAAEGKVLTASAKADVLMGYDGKRAGVYGGVGAKAAKLDGEVRAGVSIPLPWGLSIDLGAAAGGSVGGVGGEIGGGAYYDTEKKRAVASVFGGLIVLLGLKLDVEISIGKRAGVPVAAGGPDSVATGASNVYIGG